MSGEGVLFFVLSVPNIILSCFVAAAAENKGRSALAFFALSFFFTPIVGGIICGLMSRDEAELRRRAEAEALKRNPDANKPTDPALLAQRAGGPSPPVPNAQPPSPDQEAALIASGEYRRCPQCAEVIRSGAKVCRFCGADVV
jgi:hypothetical protein